MIITARYSTYEEHAYLYQLIEISREGIAAYLYYKQIEKLRKHYNSLWRIHTQNAYQTVIIKNWNKLFGTDSEPTHYKNLLTIGNLIAYTKLTDKQSLKQDLLKFANMTTEHFDQYHGEMNNYRNLYSTHTQHNPTTQLKINHPNLNPAFKTLKALHTILYLTISNLPTLPYKNINIPLNWPNYTTNEVEQLYMNDLKQSPIAITKRCT